MAGAHVHAHHVRGSNDRQALTIALALIVSFMLAEVVVGILADSLALISDAGHMLTDAAAIAPGEEIEARLARGSLTARVTARRQEA